MDEETAPHGSRRRWLNPSDLPTDWRHARSKARGEARAQQIAEELGLALTVLRPGTVFGPRNTRLAQRYLRLQSREWAVAPTAGVPQVSARDCADTRRAQAELGFRARPIEQTLAEVVAADQPQHTTPTADVDPR